MTLNGETKKFTTDGTITINDMCENTTVEIRELDPFQVKIDNAKNYAIRFYDTADAAHPTSPNSGNCGPVGVTLTHEDKGVDYLYLFDWDTEGLVTYD